MKFTDILDQCRIPYKTEGKHCRPGWVQLDCPFCQGPLYLGYNIAGNYCNCWRCGPHPVHIVALRLAKAESSESRRAIISLLKSLDKREETTLPKTGLFTVPFQDCELRRVHWQYLHMRFRWIPKGDLGQLVDLWGISGTDERAGMFKWRIFIPIYYHGNLVSWTTRSINDRVSARYISAKAEHETYNHKDLLYGEDYVRHSVVVHEGPLDVWATGPGAVATFGTGVRPAQVEKLSRYPKRVICFDSEREAQKRARALADALEPFPGETFNVVLESKDPADATPKERKMLRKFLED